MTVYVALLRAINVGGKNKVPMSDLRLVFESLGLTDVKTMLNSGNVIFTATEAAVSVDKITATLAKTFGFDIPVFVMSREEVISAVDDAPTWWGIDDGGRHDTIVAVSAAEANRIFVTFSKFAGLGDYIAVKGRVIYISVIPELRNKSAILKISRTPEFGQVTVRGANTFKKLAAKLMS